MPEFSIELNGACVLRTRRVRDIAQYLADNKLQAATSLDYIRHFGHVAISADGDIVCGFIYCTKGV